jgi:hypothetical protein
MLRENHTQVKKNKVKKQALKPNSTDSVFSVSEAFSQVETSFNRAFKKENLIHRSREKHIKSNPAAREYKTFLVEWPLQ